jgi:hypothetical protein
MREICRLVGSLFLVAAASVAVASCGGSGATSGIGDASVGDGSGLNLGADGGGNRCMPGSCQSLGYTCGDNGDGCGGVLRCGTCSGGGYCGGGGFSKCGTATPADAGPPCTPKTCADYPAGTCGQQGDGCGGIVGPCATCASPTFCGGGGPSLCGGQLGGPGDAGEAGVCTPKTCASFPPGTCGPQSDGCGGLTPGCGTCASPTFCGGGGPGLCGGNTPHAPDGGPVSSCVPATCQGLGYNCGLAGDGCGGTIGPCGPACASPMACGGGGRPNMCGSSTTCTGLCQKQVACDSGTTTLTGVVRAGLQESTGGIDWVNGAAPDPVPGVLVYIPTTAVQPFDPDPSSPQVQCQQCGANVSGNPLVLTTTDYAGRFTLSNVPVSASAGDTIPIVIQLGHWRRQYAFAITTPCAQNTLSQDLHLPSKSSEGDIPLTAISTGSYDPIECVLLKMGVAQDEFTSLPTWRAETANGTAPKPGRVHLYTAQAGSGMANPGAALGATFGAQQDETVLMGTGATGGATNGSFMLYDQILLPCWGGAVTKNAAELSNLGYYGDHGGHFFATHYSYSWLATNTNSSLSSVANWDLSADTNVFPFPNGVTFTGGVSNTVPPTVPVTNPGMFVKWLNFVGALSNGNPTGAPPAAPTVAITAGRHDVDSVAGGSVDWIHGTDPNGAVNGHTAQMELQFTFDMPIASSAAQCGHGIFADFHVNSANQSNGTTFPGECNGDKGPLTSQERILEYLIWDLASCVGPPPTATCTPRTCAAYPAGTCGRQGDGCGGLTPDCNPCGAGQLCGGCGTPGQCCTPDGGGCTPKTCADYAGLCGQQGDGCGGVTASCPCAGSLTCGGGGAAGVCGAPDGGSGCTPMTCADYPSACGVQADGCGGLTPACNPCPAGQACSGGTPAVCPGPGTCVPQTCQQLGVSCGPTGDGCGTLIPSCGTCAPPATCGGGGKPGQCGSPVAQ